MSIDMEDWFSWYCQQIEKRKEWAKYRDRYLCPCCHMPTLSERSDFEICELCFWEDDGQDTDDAETIRGGPNQDYSLKEARENFKRYLTMYRPSDKKPFEIEKKKRPIKERLYNAFSDAIRSDSDEKWQKALKVEQAIKKGL